MGLFDDASGRMVISVDTGPFKTVTYSASFDGDGQLAYETSTTSPGSSESSYIVRSTVLGDVLTRLDQWGGKKITHVPAEGLSFATQRSTGGPGPYVHATQRNPLGITETNKAVYDPLGNYIPFQAHGDPRPQAGTYSSASMPGLSSSQANSDSYGVGCIMDGMPTNCARVIKTINRGVGVKSVTILGTQNPNVALANAGLIPQVQSQTLRFRYEGSYIYYSANAIDRISVTGSQSRSEANPQDTRQQPREKNCYEFADLVSILANSMPSHTNVEFVEILWDRFSGISDEFGSDEFKPEFQDYSGTRNQARHYVGGLKAGHLGNHFGTDVGSTVANVLRETTIAPGVPTSIAGVIIPLPTILPPTDSQRADRALNVVAGRHGAALHANQIGPRDLAGRIRKDVCAPK